MLVSVGLSWFMDLTFCCLFLDKKPNFKIRVLSQHLMWEPFWNSFLKLEDLFYMTVYSIFHSLPVAKKKSGSKMDYFSINFRILFHWYEVQVFSKIFFYYFFINYYNQTILHQKFMKKYSIFGCSIFYKNFKKFQKVVKFFCDMNVRIYWK